MNETIRIPRTTVQIVTGLNFILRQSMALDLEWCEDWTLERNGSWSECGQRGECTTHGMSADYRRRLAKGDPQLLMDQETGASTCLSYSMWKIDVYTGRGSVMIDGQRATTRTWIEYTRSMAMGGMFRFRVWVKMPDGSITWGEYSLGEGSREQLLPTRCDSMPPLPRSLEFWRQDIGRPKVPVAHQYRLQMLLKQMKSRRSASVG